MSELFNEIANLSAQELALFTKLIQEKYTEKHTDVSSKVSSKQIIPQKNKLNSSALSFAQQRLWFLNQLQPNSDLYNVSGVVSLTGQLNTVALEQSFQEIVRRHEALRTTFITQEDGQPIQKIATSLNLSLPLVDLRELPEEERLFKVQQLANQEAKRVFSLNYGPLLRTTLLRLSENEHVLLITMHHIISDAWSIGVLIQELAALYEAFTEGRLSPLPELHIQYTDFAAWQRQWLQGEVLETQLSYWKRQLAGIPPMLELPTDRPRPKVQSFRGATQFFELSPSLSEALMLLSQRSGATLFMTLLAAFQTLLYRYTATEDICIGTSIANRNLSETEQLIGFFVNTLVLRTNVSKNPSFQELLNQVREMTLGAYAHQDLPFEQLVETLQPERSLSHQPLFQVAFTLQNTPTEALKLPGLIINPLEVKNTTAKFDLTLEMEESKQGLIGSFEYNVDLFDDTTITRMLSHFRTILEAIVKNPSQRIADLSLLTPIEHHQLLLEWNNTEIQYPLNTYIHHLIEVLNNNKSLTNNPIGNYQIYILDQNLQPLPIGVPGELYIGVSVANSYLNSSELTTEKFIPNPFTQDKKARLYNTGYRVRYLANGNIELIGHLDEQVEIRGYHIALRQIEAKLTQHTNVRSAVVLPIENNCGDKRLVAYVVPEKHLQNHQENSQIDYVDAESNNPKNLNQYLKSYLNELLPHYMMPSDFILLESLPLTLDGKVDRHTLTILGQAQSEITSNFVPPRDTLELKLVEIWEEVLNVQPLGVKDNFFDLGGYSLLAIRLISKIQQQFERDLPMTTLFSSPTIEQLANFIRKSSEVLPWNPVVAIQEDGLKQPLFFMPGGGGTVVYLYHLAHYLGADQPFYGLQARGLDGESLPHTRVEEIAAYNIQAMRTIQPQGPYLLGGHSFGSFVAFEMAIQLQLSGEKVALLALMDTPTNIISTVDSTELDDTTYLISLTKNVEGFTGKKFPMSYEELQQFNQEQQLNCVLEWLKAVNIFPAEAKLKQLRGYLQVFKANEQTVYQPQSIYHGQITVFKATENKYFGDDIFMGWDKFSSLPIESQLISANHISMMTEPQVQTLGEKLKSSIDNAQ
ncbi:MAG: AMP-binding protein [Scytonematopsis contorta HA4267-MV1]|jgi:thioesterase domain-containing protein/acyl carrier protein|nr:AMP-binding protein [Scytonematopsis contorta HA4267-MV1]